ncbi:hypothetical protein NQ176_g526 [Zarea fungicola]|uniref:Uncharacterized protein n=1 Tax=Zarea fungicola TaxID=93591 RepID=A0ACC1NZC9_9HYPO|nr:hypothetical protein NQ176_g526 [Lecanicillium fungicola]
MVAQYHAPCRRAVYQAPGRRRTLITSITFGSAIERFPRRTITQYRHLMSHRGPLESRRRLGKRNLTGAMHPAPRPVPSWHFEILSNATTWQWQGPTTIEERRARSFQLTIPSLWGKFLAWLEMSDADRPYIIPPSDVNDYPSVSTTINDLRVSIASLSATDAESAKEICQSFCTTVQDGILAGRVSLEDMLKALKPFDDASCQAITNMQIGNKLHAMIRSSVVDALEATELSIPGLIATETWIAIFEFVTTINGRFHDVTCFQKLIAAMPQSARAKLSNKTIFNYSRSFINAQARIDNLNPEWAWCCAKVGTAISYLNTGQRLALSASVNKYLQNSRFNAETRTKVSFAWLLTQAYDARMSDTVFTTTYRKHSRCQMDSSGYRIWQLAVARLRSNGYLSKEAYRDVAWRKFNDSLPSRWAALADTLVSLEQPQRAIASLSACLADIGETWHLIEGLIMAHAETPRADLLRVIADSSGKLDIFLALHMAIGEAGQGDKLLGPWRSATWKQHFDMFMAYPKAESYLWRAIKARGGNREVKMELIDLLSGLYVDSPELSRSQKMRRVQRAAAYQKAQLGTVSPIVIRNAITAVTLDLEEGLWGRDRLLKWAVRLVHDNCSPQEARKMKKEVDGWRHLVEQSTSRPAASTGGPLSRQESKIKQTPFEFSQLREVVDEFDGHGEVSSPTQSYNRFS